jgi:hypothetical protein
MDASEFPRSRERKGEGLKAEKLSWWHESGRVDVTRSSSLRVLVGKRGSLRRPLTAISLRGHPPTRVGFELLSPTDNAQSADFPW